jgi:L-rhamnose-H+ transport protein
MLFPSIAGLFLVIAAGILQGVFLLPLDYLRKLNWENSWFLFSLFGMLVFNWTLGLKISPHLTSIYKAVPILDLGMLSLFGIGWGLGAVLFGLGMARLGLSLGYPIIMGLIAALGALLPLLVFFPSAIYTTKGVLVILACVIVLGGIVLCSRAAASKTVCVEEKENRPHLGASLMIAVGAGALSCLPNIGMSFSGRLFSTAKNYGVEPAVATDMAWVIFFSAGFTVNAAYCLYLMARNHTAALFVSRDLPRNVLLTATMGLLWIGSFYGYGAGASKLGSFGSVIGWPLFIATSISVGNLVGIWRGEWRSAVPRARSMLSRGLLLMGVALAVLCASGTVPGS